MTGTPRRTTLLDLGRPWYWPSEAASIMQISRKTVYNWIKDGRLRPILKVRPFKIPREQIEQYLNN